MPSIPDTYIKSIATLIRDGIIIGTAFVARHFDVVDGVLFHSFYLITCEHCVNKSIAAHFCNGKSLQIAPDQWCRSHTKDDVVAFDISKFHENRADIGFIGINTAVVRARPGFSVGADIYMLGLLLDADDIGEKIPRARFGNLSAFADDKIVAELGNGVSRPCHLGDMRSRTGFSGSPVIGYTQTTTMNGVISHDNRLLGVHSAQHHERISISNESNVKGINIPSSMTRIVPASAVIELLNNELLIAAREERMSKK